MKAIHSHLFFQKETYKSRLGFVLTAVAILLASIASPTAHAAACTPPGTDYGTVTYTASVATTGTYRIWLRMSAPSSSVNTVLVDIDSATCYTMGGTGVPTYAGGATTYFANNTSNWVNYVSGGGVISHSFTSGSHTIKLIGTGSGVVVDRLIVTSDDTCTPTGSGDNCAMVYIAPDINMDGSVSFLDFSALASKYGQSNGSLGRSDINRDGTVNFLDFSLLANKYGQ